MNKAYKDLVDGLAQVGDALVAIGNDKEPAPIKLLVSELVTKLNLNNGEAVDTLTMLRYAVDNDDSSLVKLTEYVTGTPEVKTPEVTPEEAAEPAPKKAGSTVEEPNVE